METENVPETPQVVEPEIPKQETPKLKTPNSKSKTCRGRKTTCRMEQTNKICRQLEKQPAQEHTPQEHTVQEHASNSPIDYKNYWIIGRVIGIAGFLYLIQRGVQTPTDIPVQIPTENPKEIPVQDPFEM